MKILGISAFYHDSAACIIEDGNIIAAAQEERFSRKKHDDSFPAMAAAFCLKTANCSVEQLDAIAFYDKPLLKFERLLETYYAFAPKGVASFVKSIPLWLSDKVFLKRVIRKEFKKMEPKAKLPKIFFPEHHLSHAASTFYASSFSEAAILTIDGVGEWSTASIGHGKNNQIEVLKELHFPHSVGLLYSAFTYFLGFRVNSGEYKLMGLAPYGNANSQEVKNFEALITNHLADVAPDGSVKLNMDYFKFATGIKMIHEKRWENLFGFPMRRGEKEPEQHHCNLALAIQNVTEDIVLKMAKTAKDITGAPNICLAGGVALNCVANGKLLRSGIFDDVFIQPAAGDAGGALGAAWATYYLYFENPRQVQLPDMMQGSQLGPAFTDAEIKATLDKLGAVYSQIDSEDTCISKAATLIDEGNILGWFHGRMEYGPRALGNRSILGDARNPEMQKKLNLKIKYRESFRPFAPSVLEEERSRIFDLHKASPYMLLVAQVSDKVLHQLPENYQQLALREKLYVNKSELPAITHVDLSARIQSVSKETSPRYWKLIRAFKEISSWGIVVNTSFNVRGEPIVCTPEDAFKCFMNTEMDYLFLENFMLDKKAQKKELIKSFKVETILD